MRLLTRGLELVAFAALFAVTFLVLANIGTWLVRILLTQLGVTQ